MLSLEADEGSAEQVVSDLDADEAQLAVYVTYHTYLYESVQVREAFGLPTGDCVGPQGEHLPGEAGGLHCCVKLAHSAQNDLYHESGRVQHEAADAADQYCHVPLCLLVIAAYAVLTHHAQLWHQAVLAA